MSCNCSKCNTSKPCGCEDNPLHTPCSYTNCEDGNPCEEVICEECVVYCGTTFSWCTGEQQIEALSQEIKTLQSDKTELEVQIKEFQGQYDEAGCPNPENPACEILLKAITDLQTQVAALDITIEQKTTELNNLTAAQFCITIENGERLDVTLQRIIQMIGNGISECAYSDKMNAPLGLSISNVTADSAKISWQTISSLTTGLNVELIDITGGATNYTSLITLQPTQFSYTMTGLLSDNEYAARISATDDTTDCKSVSVYFKTLLP
jgi:hypothetical protein